VHRHLRIALDRAWHAERPRRRVRVRAEDLSEEDLVRLAIQEREQRARTERMSVQPLDASRPWTDYVVTSTGSGRSYRVALRCLEHGTSYCSCPDFRKNTLGTCKHLLHVERKARRRFSAARLRRPYQRQSFSVYRRYDRKNTLHLGFPARALRAEVDALVARFASAPSPTSPTSSSGYAASSA
jgi:hypothetical protein